jgi:hypothetical protein
MTEVTFDEIVLTPEELWALAKHADGCALTIVRSTSASDEGYYTVTAEATEGGFRLKVYSSVGSGEVTRVERTELGER